MKHFFDILLTSLLIVLIYSVYTVGGSILEKYDDDHINDTETAYYRCGKNKKTEIYCPIVVKGG